MTPLAHDQAAVTFYRHDRLVLSGVVTMPSRASSSEPVPAVVLCQGLSGVKHLVLPEIAAGLASRGIASLRFDYAGYGESDGARGWIDPRARTDDALSALAFLCGQNGVDPRRVGVYGHSYGGPVAIHLAARDPRARAVVSVSGPGDGRDLLRAVRPSWDWVALRNRVAVERAAVAGGADPSVVGVEEIFPFSPAFLAAYQKLKAEAGGSSAMAGSTGIGTDLFYLLSVDAMVDFRPSDAARRLTGQPLLVVHGTDDDTAPIETVEPVFAAAPGPKRWEPIAGAAHNDLDGGPGLKRVIGLAGDWFSQYL